MKRIEAGPRVTRLIIITSVFVLLIAGSLIYFRDALYPFFMARPSINAMIVLLGIVGLFISFFQLARFYNQASYLDSIAELSDEDEIIEKSEKLRPGLVKDRIDRVIHLSGGASPMESMTMISDSDISDEESKGAFVKYVLGVMVFLGLIGTFWGVLITVQGVQRVLDALEPTKVSDSVEFVTQLKNSMGGLLKGLSTAFSTSLFGLAGSVLLGFVDLQARKARVLVLSELDLLVVSTIFPAVTHRQGPAQITGAVVEESDSHDDRLYHLASQEALGENLRFLADVIGRQSTMDQRITDSIVEIKSMLEMIREEQEHDREFGQTANSLRKSLIDRMDAFNRNMEKLVKDNRLSKESGDEIGRALLDRLKLEGEITNKTLSMGFSDLKRQLETFKTRKDAPGREGE